MQREGLPPLPAMVEDGLRSARSPQSRNKPDTEGLLAPSSEELIADVEDLRRDELALKKLRIQKQIEGRVGLLPGAGASAASRGGDWSVPAPR